MTSCACAAPVITRAAHRPTAGAPSIAQAVEDPPWLWVSSAARRSGMSVGCVNGGTVVSAQQACLFFRPVENSSRPFCLLTLRCYLLSVRRKRAKTRAHNEVTRWLVVCVCEVGAPFQRTSTAKFPGARCSMRARSREGDARAIPLPVLHPRESRPPYDRRGIVE